jgi:polyisoprenoid-binding protein YceI
MKKLLFLGFLSFLVVSTTSAQKFYTKNGKISFFSSASMENIEAHNRSVSTVVDAGTGDVQFSVLMKGFEFKKALMQEHFNKNYVESDKFPKSSFTGKIVNNGDIRYTINGIYNAQVKGKLTIHGVTREVDIPGTITVTDGKLSIRSTFNVLVADYNISIPRIYKDNIAKSIRVSVDCSLSPL